MSRRVYACQVVGRPPTCAHNARARRRRHICIASNKTRRKWVDEHKSGTIGSVGRCPRGLGSGQWTLWPREMRAAWVLHTLSHALLPSFVPDTTSRPLPPFRSFTFSIVFPATLCGPWTFSLSSPRTHFAQIQRLNVSRMFRYVS